MKTTILKNEFWYGGAVYEGYRQPVGADDIVDWDFRENPTHNQIMPLFLSSKGRYIWSDAGFHISFRNGEILLSDPEEYPEICKRYSGKWFSIRCSDDR